MATLRATAAFTLYQIACLLHLLLQRHTIAKSRKKLKMNYYMECSPNAKGLECAAKK